MNLWHDISRGESADSFNCIVEIPRNSLNKYEIDKETGMIALDRVNHTGQTYPFDYGFVPQTLWEDGDALDVIILTTEPLFPGCLIHVRPVGLMKMIDGGESDDKILAVPTTDPRWDDVKNLADVNDQQKKIIQHFFENYKKLQNKEVIVDGFEDVAAAKAAFEKSVKLYEAR